MTVIEALLDVLGTGGTLVMPGESPQLADPATWNDPRVDAAWHEAIREHLPVFDPRTTPTTMGAIPEAFRTYPGTRRSHHPLVSVCANGRLAEVITREHPLAFCEGRGTQLHFAESLVESRRTKVMRMLAEVDGRRAWIDMPQMGADGGRYFPEVGRAFVATGQVTAGRIGNADSLLFSTRALVDFAAPWFARTLADQAAPASCILNTMSDATRGFDPSTITRPDERLMKYYVVVALLSVFAFPITLFVLWIKYRTLRYRFDDEGIWRAQGLLWRSEVNITYRRIQDIHLTNGLLQRWFGLATVSIQTAAGSASPEVTIEGVLEAEALRDFLYTKMRGVRDLATSAAHGGRTIPPARATANPARAVDESDEALALLIDIRDALRRLETRAGSTERPS